MKAAHSLGQALSASVENVLAPLLLQTPSKALSSWLLKSFLESQKSVYASLIASLAPCTQPQAAKPLQVLQAAHNHLEEVEVLLKEKSRLKSKKPATPESGERILRLSRRILDCLLGDSQLAMGSAVGSKPASPDALADALSRNTLFEDGTETLDSEQNKAAFRQHLLKIDSQLSHIRSDNSPQQSPSFKENLSRHLPSSGSPIDKSRTLEKAPNGAHVKYFLPAKDLTFHFQSQLTTKTASLPQISLFNDSPLRSSGSPEAEMQLYRRFKLCFLLDFAAVSRLRSLFFGFRRSKLHRIEQLEIELAKERVVNLKLLEALKHKGLNTDQAISQTFVAKDPQRASKLLQEFSHAFLADPGSEPRELSFQEALPRDRPGLLRPSCVSNQDLQKEALCCRLTDYGIHRTFSARNMEEQPRLFQPFLRTSNEKSAAAASIASLRRLQEVASHFPNSIKGWAGRLELPGSAGLLQKQSAVQKRLQIGNQEVDSRTLESSGGSPKLVGQRPSAMDFQKPGQSASSSRSQGQVEAQDKNSLFLQKQIKKTKTLGSQAKRYFANSTQSSAKGPKAKDRKGQMSLTQLQQFFDQKKLSEDKQRIPRPPG